MKKEKNSEQEKLHCFINIYITKQAQIDQQIINVEGLFSGLRDIWIAVSVSFPLNDYKIQCLHGAGVPGRIDKSRVDLTTKQK